MEFLLHAFLFLFDKVQWAASPDLLASRLWTQQKTSKTTQDDARISNKAARTQLKGQGQAARICIEALIMILLYVQTLSWMTKAVGM